MDDKKLNERLRKIEVKLDELDRSQKNKKGRYLITAVITLERLWRLVKRYLIDID